MLRPTFSVAARGPPPPNPGRPHAALVEATRGPPTSSKPPNTTNRTQEKNIDILRMVPHHWRRLDVPLQLTDTIQRKSKIKL